MASSYALGRFVGPGIARLLSHVERSVVCTAPKSCQKSPFVVHSWRCKHTGTRNAILCSRKIHGLISNTQAGSCFTPKRFHTSKLIAAYIERCSKNLNLDDFKSLKICSRRFNSSTYAQRKVLSSASAMNPPSVKQIEHFLNSNNIAYEHGHTSIVVACQHCEKEKKDGKSLYVNKTTGSHYCKTCGRSGTWRQFKAMFSDKESNKSTSGSLLQPVYSEGIAMTTNSDSDKKAKEIWDASLSLREAEESLRKKIEESFHIEKLNKDTLTKYKVHVTQHKFSEPSGEFSNHQCLVFPWFDSNNSTVCGVKLVKIEQDDNGLVALQPRLGTLGLFGWNTVTPEAKEVVLTVNEFDAIAVHQATSRPAISLPLGAYSLPPEVLPQLEQFERIILWFGEDVRARQAANQFSKKLSIQRCNIVRPAGDKPPSGPLDALNKGFDLSELINSSKPISHEKIATFQELRADVYSEMVNAEQVAGVKWSRFPKLNSLLKGHRRGELTIFTGPTGAGKTTLLSEMSVDLCQQGVNTLWGSFEIRNVRLAKMMMNQFSGMDLQKNVQQFNYWADKFEMLPMYFMCFYGSQSINTVIETMAHAVYVFDIDHVIIDNLQFMTSSLRAEDRFSIQNQAISCLRDFASSKNVHVTLVIHPRKENDDVELQTASIFGTAKASQEADNVLILQDKKGRGEKYLQVTKNRFDGSVGRVPLEFVKSSLSMCGFGKKDNNNNKNIQNTFKVSRKVSDIDMINIPSSAPIQKARARPYSPGYSKAGGSVTGGARISNSETLPHGVPDQTLSHSIISKTHSPGTQKSDIKMAEGATKSNTKTSPPEFSTPKKGARLSFSSKDVESVRTFQENLSESIRSKGLGEKSPVPTPSKVTGDEKKLNAKKLYSKTIASLVAKHVTKHRIQKKPLRTDAVRPAVKTSK